MQDVHFVQGDVRTFDLECQFDVCMMAGVLSIFDDYETILKQMLHHVKPNGYAYIFGGFTTENIDVIVRHRRNYAGSNEWESGFNMLSLQMLERVVTPLVKNIVIHKFDIRVDIPKKDDPVASYTVKTEEGKRLIINGLNIVRDFYGVELQK